MAYPKGSVIVTDGNGKVTALEPQQDNMVLVFNSSKPKGIDWANNSDFSQKIFKSSLEGTSQIKSKEYIVAINISISENINTISNISVLSYMDNKADSYDVRVYDITNDNIIAEKNFTNTSMEINDLGTLSNLPTNDAIFEVQVKINASKLSWSKAYIKEVNVFYS